MEGAQEAAKPAAAAKPAWGKLPAAGAVAPAKVALQVASPVSWPTLGDAKNAPKTVPAVDGAAPATPPVPAGQPPADSAAKATSAS